MRTCLAGSSSLSSLQHSEICSIIWKYESCQSYFLSFLVRQTWNPTKTSPYPTFIFSHTIETAPDSRESIREDPRQSFLMLEETDISGTLKMKWWWPVPQNLYHPRMDVGY